MEVKMGGGERKENSKEKGESQEEGVFKNEIEGGKRKRVRGKRKGEAKKKRHEGGREGKREDKIIKK